MVRCWLDIDIGDAAQYALESRAFARAQALFDTIKSQYGWPEELSSLDEEQRDLLTSAYDSDPSWRDQGTMQATPPTPLRAGRLTIELFTEAAPRACENFRCLCTGERGKGKSSGKPLHFKGTKFHRIVKGFVCQGGDIVKGDGSGGDSIYGKPFNDEKGGLKLKHDAAGIVSMANKGKNSNTSQFFLTLGPAPACDGKHTVFGRVVEGLPILQRIDALAASKDGDPLTDVCISDSGYDG
ncbi:CYN16 [Auxenochlorella protothecoides x Auxenochlorella symbiontica]